MEYFPIIILSLALLLAMVRPVTLFCHELGHAIPAMILTRQMVSVYIGSYGNPSNSVSIRVGLLEIWVNRNPLSWYVGLCVPSAKKVSFNKQIAYTLAGSLTSIFVSGVVFILTYASDIHSSVKVIFTVFFASAVFDLFTNLIPRATPIRLHDGRLTYNDGHTLKQLFLFKRLPKEFESAYYLYCDEKFSNAASLCSALLKKGIVSEELYRLAIISALRGNDLIGAKEISDKFISWGVRSSDDYTVAGIVYSKMNFHENSFEFYDKSLEMKPDDLYSLFNKGLSLNALNRFAEAIPLFDKVIEIDGAFAYAYSNRGLSKIKTGYTQEGLDDINHAFELDENDVFGFRNLGIYHLDKGECSEALNFFKRAKELDSTIHMIDVLILTARDCN